MIDNVYAGGGTFLDTINTVHGGVRLPTIELKEDKDNYYYVIKIFVSKRIHTQVAYAESFDENKPPILNVGIFYKETEEIEISKTNRVYPLYQNNVMLKTDILLDMIDVTSFDSGFVVTIPKQIKE